MVASSNVLRSAPGSKTSAPTPSETPTRPGGAQALRGQPLAVQQKALAPNDQPGFEQQEAALKPADAGPKPADGAPAPATPQAPGKAPVPAPSKEGPLTDPEVVQAMVLYRRAPLPFEAVAAFQVKEGLEPTGVVDRATLQRVATIRMAPAPEANAEAATAPKAAAPKPKGRPPKQPSKVQLGLPDVAFMKAQGIEVTVGKEDFKAAGLRASSSAPLQDFACRAVEKKSYGEYVATLCGGSFLGFPITVHKDLLSRLRAAERFLASKFPEVSGDPKTLAARLGVTSVSHFRPSSEKNDQMNHGLGFAIDLNPGTNPWVFGNTGRSTQNAAFPIVLERAAAFVGSGMPLTASGIAKMAQKMTTTELVDQLGLVDKSLEDYRKFGKLEKGELREVVKRRLAESKAVAKLGDEAFWMKKIPFDDLIMGKYIEDQSNSKDKKTHSGGFMDLQPIVIQAMRDVAGLRWGATDMGPENGDMMHFDGMGPMKTCNALNGALHEARKKLADPAPKGGDTKKA